VTMPPTLHVIARGWCRQAHHSTRPWCGHGWKLEDGARTNGSLGHGFDQEAVMWCRRLSFRVACATILDKDWRGMDAMSHGNPSQ
jgi:hypothetical protein